MRKKKFLFCLILGLVIFLEIALRVSKRLNTYQETNFGYYFSQYESNDGHLFVWNKSDTINVVQNEFEFTYIMNKYGLNDLHNLDSCSPNNSIIYLGDSFTFGVGASQEENLPTELEKLLSLNVINAGIPGSDPFYERVLIDSIFKPLGFKKYLIMVNISDIYDYVIRGGAERFTQNNIVTYRKAPSIEHFYKHSHLVRFYVHMIIGMDYSLLPPDKMKALKDEALVSYTSLLIELSNELNCLVVLQPYARQYANNSAMLSEVLDYAYLEKLDSSLRANNIKTINLDPSLKSIMGPDNYLDYSWELDGHYNHKGYELLATLLALKLEEKYPDFIQMEEKQ